MLFINNEGTEDGGLIYGGAMKDGKPSSFSHLSFDQYDQDQTVVLGTALSPDGTRNAGITLNDAPDEPITPELYAKRNELKPCRTVRSERLRGNPF
jgi:predicted outer membrane repeat protein